MNDKRLHCVGAAEIARVCSPLEARFAAWGKEIGDAAGDGDADPADVAASMAGIACARSGESAPAVERCCADRGY